MKVLLVVALLVTCTTAALKCFEKPAVEVPTDDTKLDLSGDYIDCGDSVTKCYNTTWSVGGTDKIQYGCGDEDMCATVNVIQDKRKKRDSEIASCTVSGSNITPDSLAEGEHTLACEEGYTGNEDATDELRYCYNGIAWKSYEYAGEAVGDYTEFACTKDDELWVTVTYTAATDTVPVVSVAGEIVTEDTDYLESAESVVDVYCLMDNFEEDTETVATAWPTVLDADLGIDSLTLCSVNDGFELVAHPVVTDVTFTVTTTGKVLPQGLSSTEDTNVDLTCEKGTLYDLKIDELIDGGELMVVTGPVWYRRNDTEKTVELTVTDFSCELDDTRAIVAVVPATDRYQRLCKDTDCSIDIDADTAVDENLYVVCQDGWEPPADDANWGAETFVLLTFAAADPGPSTLQLADVTDWSASAVAACVEKTEVADVDCVVSLLTDLGLSLFDTDLTAIDSTDDIEHGVNVVVVCDAVGRMPGFEGDVELQTYQCNQGSWGTIYSTCSEYTDCTTTTCEENACNSSTGIFAGLSLVVGLLLFLTI